MPIDADRRKLAFSVALLPVVPFLLRTHNGYRTRTTKVANWIPTFSDFNISPNGETVVFSVGTGGISLGLGLYDWRNDRVRRIPNPRDGYFSDGDFSSDGKMLCAVKVSRTGGMRYSNIVRIDAHSFEATDVTEPLAVASYVSYPVFQPDSANIMFIQWHDPGPATLQLMESSPGGTVSFMAPGEGFSRIYRPSFASEDSIIFMGRHPRSKELRARIDSRFVSGENIFRVRLGGHPELAFPDIEASVPRAGAGYGFVSCSQNGARIIGLGLNLDQPYGPSGQFNYELFQLNSGGRPKQLTNLRGFLGFCRVAYLGSTVCFGSREGRDGPMDLNIMDLATGAVTRTNLRRRLEGNLEFSPP